MHAAAMNSSPDALCQQAFWRNPASAFPAPSRSRSMFLVIFTRPARPNRPVGTSPVNTSTTTCPRGRRSL